MAMASRRLMSSFGSVFKPGLFDNKVAIVTGGGTGIGKAIATELAILGCKVVISSRKIDVLQKCSAELNEKLPKELVTPIQCNIRSENEVLLLAHLAICNFMRTPENSGFCIRYITKS